MKELLVVERAVPPGNTVEWLKFGAKRPRKSGEISFLGYGVAAGEDAVGTRAD